MYRNFANKQSADNTPQLTARYQQSHPDFDGENFPYDAVNIPPLVAADGTSKSEQARESLAWFPDDEEEGEEEGEEY